MTPRRVAVILAGAGARGAYEAGVLAELLPRLDRAGARPALHVGTGAGALNATMPASTAHLPVDEQVGGCWRRGGASAPARWPGRSGAWRTGHDRRRSRSVRPGPASAERRRR